MKEETHLLQILGNITPTLPPKHIHKIIVQKLVGARIEVHLERMRIIRKVIQLVLVDRPDPKVASANCSSFGEEERKKERKNGKPRRPKHGDAPDVEIETREKPKPNR